MLSDDREETEATDSGRDEEGIVKDRTMDLGRPPRLSSGLEGWRGREREGGRGEARRGPFRDFWPGTVRTLGLSVSAAWTLSRPKLPTFMNSTHSRSAEDDNSDYTGDF